MNNRFPDVAGSEGEEAGRGASFDGGSLLRFAREAAGLHIGALAVTLKVPLKKLEALESDRYDLLPDVAFARALASSVCRNLKIDAGPVLERLPQINNSKFAFSGRGINAPFRVPGESLRPTIWAYISRPAALGGLTLLLGALVLMLLPAAQETVDRLKSAVFDTNNIRAAVDPLPLESSTGSFAPGSPQPLNTGAGSLIVPNLDGVPSFVAGGKVEALTLAASVPVSGTIVQGTSSPGSLSKEVLTFSARGQSWVEVTDAKGAVVLQRTLAIGEVVGVSGLLPLAAVVGRADAVVVEVRGTQLELASVSKNNVARFEVK
jgi:cytoskeleton protein RodZ